MGGVLVKGESTESAEDDPELLEMELPEWLQELPDDLEVGRNANYNFPYQFC